MINVTLSKSEINDAEVELVLQSLFMRVINILAAITMVLLLGKLEIF